MQVLKFIQSVLFTLDSNDDVGIFSIKIKL